MIGEFNIAGVFVSPLLLCLLAGFATRMLLSKLLTATGLYRHVWQRPLFDTALLFVLTGVAFAALRLATSR